MPAIKNASRNGYDGRFWPTADAIQVALNQHAELKGRVLRAYRAMPISERALVNLPSDLRVEGERAVGKPVRRLSAVLRRACRHCMQAAMRTMSLRLAALTVLLTVSGCNGLYFGDNPRPDVSKERGPLTTPPPLRAP